MTSVIVTTSNFEIAGRQSTRVVGLSTRPSTVRVQDSGSITVGGMPLLRMKWRAVGGDGIVQQVGRGFGVEGDGR